MTDGADWLRLLADDFGVGDYGVDGEGADDLLAFTAEIAHGVARPAAPLSAFLVGLAAGRHGGSPDDIGRALARARTLLAEQ
jgi:hypothetical protein